MILYHSESIQAMYQSFRLSYCTSLHLAESVIKNVPHTYGSLIIHLLISLTGLVNKNVPRTFGDGIIHSSHVDVMVEGDELLPEFTGMKLTPEIHEIARLIADDLVQDGATIQTGNVLF